MLPSADKLYGDADFIFQQDLAPAHTVKGTKSWFNDHGVTVLDWPANSPDLNPSGHIVKTFQGDGGSGGEVGPVANSVANFIQWLQNWPILKSFLFNENLGLLNNLLFTIFFPSGAWNRRIVVNIDN